MNQEQFLKAENSRADKRDKAYLAHLKSMEAIAKKQLIVTEKTMKALIKFIKEQP